MESPESVICKIPARARNQYFIIKSTWHEPSVDLEIIDMREQKDNEWKGTILEDDIAASARDLEIGVIYDEIKSGLCTNGGLPCFEYSVENARFTMHKVFPFRELYCEAILSRAPGLLQQLFMNSVDTANALRKELTTKKLDYQKLEMEFELLAQSSEKSVRERREDEKQILTKCAALLNTKKNKIAELQELLLEGRKLASQKDMGTIVNQLDDGDDEQTQPMSLPETQRAENMLPKRKNLVAAEAVEKRIKSDERALPAPGEFADVDSDVNSEEMFDAMK